MKKFTRSIPRGWGQIANTTLFYRALKAEAQRVNHPSINAQILLLEEQSRGVQAAALNTLRRAIRNGDDLGKVIL